MLFIGRLWDDFWCAWHSRRAEALQERVLRHIAALKGHMLRRARR